jgi:hypothetical protein
MSGILILAISSSCLRVILPTLAVFGVRLADQHGGRRGLGDEGEAAVVVDRDHHRDRQTLLELLRLGVERLAELHDVHALLAQRRTDGRCRVRLACRDLQLHVGL